MLGLKVEHTSNIFICITVDAEPFTNVKLVGNYLVSKQPQYHNTRFLQNVLKLQVVSVSSSNLHYPFNHMCFVILYYYFQNISV